MIYIGIIKHSNIINYLSTLRQLFPDNNLSYTLNEFFSNSIYKSIIIILNVKKKKLKEQV